MTPSTGPRFVASLDARMTSTISLIHRALAVLLGSSALALAHDGHLNSAAFLDPATLQKFVDPLPIPPVAGPLSTNDGVPLYLISMNQVSQKLHRDLPATQVWGYNGIFPGPTFETRPNVPIDVIWSNALPAGYPAWLPVDTNLHGVHNADVRTVVHLHGGRTPPESDGHPNAWYRTGESARFHYPNIEEDGASLWYHDHAIGVTRLNIYAGLAGLYFVRNVELERQFNLPSGAFELPLIIQDRDLDQNGQLMIGDICRAFSVVNGKIWPYLNVEPRKYRLRLLNGANFRILRLKFSNGQPFIQIGTDSGFLPAPVSVDELLLGPAERADVIVDFSQHAGASITLSNTTSCFGPERDHEVPPHPDEVRLPEIMQFRVAPAASSVDSSSIPASLVAPRWASQTLVEEAAQNREISLDEYPNFLMLIDERHFDAPVKELPRLGESEVWSLINLTQDTHPIHIHLVEFVVVERRAFKSGGVDQYKTDRSQGALKPLSFYLEADPMPIPLEEQGPKDTALARINTVTRVAMRWAGFPGDYVFHCHVLNHEDNDMMRPMRVLPPKPEFISQPQSQTVLPGSRVTFAVTVDPHGPAAYQWQKDGVDLPGKTDPLLSLSNVTASATGNYALRVSNPEGSSLSRAAPLYVVNPRPGEFVIHPSADDPLIRFYLRTEATHSYRIERAAKLNDWMPWRVFPGTDGLLEITDMPVEASHFFYRARIE